MACECDGGICWCIGPEIDPDIIGQELVRKLNQRTRLRLARSRSIRPLHPKAQEMVDSGLFGEDMADVAHHLTHPEDYNDPEAQEVDEQYDLDAFPEAEDDMGTEDALDLEDGMTDQALEREQEAPDYTEDRCPECGYPAEVDADGFTEGDEGDYPVPGWYDLTDDEQQAARDQFRQFLARQEQEQPQPSPDPYLASRRPDGSFTLGM